MNHALTMAHMIQFCSDPINLMTSQVWELIGVGAEQNHGRCSSQMQKDALEILSIRSF